MKIICDFCARQSNPIMTGAFYKRPCTEIIKDFALMYNHNLSKLPATYKTCIDFIKKGLPNVYWKPVYYSLLERNAAASLVHNLWAKMEVNNFSDAKLRFKLWRIEKEIRNTPISFTKSY